MSIVKITPNNNEYVFTNNSANINIHRGKDSFKNGNYTISSSSYSDNLHDAYNAFNSINDYWKSGDIKNNQNNIMLQDMNDFDLDFLNNDDKNDKKGYFSNKKNSSAASFTGDKEKYNTWVTTLYDKNQILGEWIQIHLPYSVIISKYSFIVPVNGNNPRKFYLLGSNDQIRWHILDSQNLFEKYPKYDNYTFEVIQNEKFSYFRLVISELFGSNEVTISNINLYGYLNIFDMADDNDIKYDYGNNYIGNNYFGKNDFDNTNIPYNNDIDLLYFNGKYSKKPIVSTIIVTTPAPTPGPLIPDKMINDMNKQISKKTKDILKKSGISFEKANSNHPSDISMNQLKDQMQNSQKESDKERKKMMKDVANKSNKIPPSQNINTENIDKYDNVNKKANNNVDVMLSGDISTVFNESKTIEQNIYSDFESFTNYYSDNIQFKKSQLYINNYEKSVMDNSIKPFCKYDQNLKSFTIIDGTYNIKEAFENNLANNQQLYGDVVYDINDIKNDEQTISKNFQDICGNIVKLNEKRKILNDDKKYDFNGNVLLGYNTKPNLLDAVQEDNQIMIIQQNNIYILGTITLAILLIGTIIIAK